MTVNHPPIDLWDEVAIFSRRIITPQRHNALPSAQTGLKLNSQTDDANLKRHKTFVAEGLKGG